MEEPFYTPIDNEANVKEYSYEKWGGHLGHLDLIKYTLIQEFDDTDWSPFPCYRDTSEDIDYDIYLGGNFYECYYMPHMSLEDIDELDMSDDVVDEAGNIRQYVEHLGFKYSGDEIYQDVQMTNLDMK